MRCHAQTDGQSDLIGIPYKWNMPKTGPTLHVSTSTAVNFGAQLPIHETGTLGGKTMNCR